MSMAKAKEIASSSPVVVFSKSYCRNCVQVKNLLSKLRATLRVIELNSQNDGTDLQASLAAWTGQRAVPTVFIGGNHIDGCDATTNMHSQGKLMPLLIETEAIARASSST